MKKSWLFLWGILLLAVASAPAQEIERFRLPNGLTVVVQPDRQLPLVNVTCMYRVGSANEAPGITGMAHYVEHMSFRATENIAKADLTGTIERIGGRWNGYTSLDQTLYAATVPTWALETVLNIEAERMARTLFDPDEFERERTSVIAELQSYENDPASILWDKVLATSFELHPYRYNIIGWLTDVQAIKHEEALHFYKDYYGPNNAVLAIVGDVDPRQVRSLVEKHFAGLSPAPRSAAVRVVEPMQQGEKRVTVVHPSSQAHLLMVFRAPPATHSDFPVLLVLDALLASGRSLVSLPGLSDAAPASRLEQVLEAAGGGQAGTALTPTRAPYVYGIGVATDSPSELERLEKAVMAALERMEREGVAAEEVAQATRRLRAADAFESSRLADVAHRLAYYEALGSWDLTEEIRKGAAEVDSEDVQAYIRRWLRPEQRTMGVLLPGEAEVEKAAGPPSRPEPAPTQRPSPVPSAALQPVPAPAVETLRRVLSNGAVVRAARRDGPAASLRIRVGIGSALDPPGQEGLALLAARLLTGDPAFNAGLAQRGALLTNTAVDAPTEFAHREYFDLSLRFLPDDFDVVARVARTLQESSFDPSRIEDERRGLLEEIRELKADATGVAAERALRRVEPEWRPPMGTEESVKRITAEDVNDFLNRHLRGGGVWATLVAPGEPAAALGLLAAAFAGVRAGSPAIPEASRGSAVPGEDRVAMAGKTRAELVAALPGVARQHRDYLPLRLLNYILGETGYAGRLGKALVDPGLVYSVYAVPHFDRQPGPLLIETGTAAGDLEAVLNALHDVLAGLSQDGIEEWERREAQAYVLGRMVFGLESDEVMAHTLVEQDYFGEDLLDFSARSAKVLAVTRDRLNETARRYYRPESLSVGVAGALPDSPKGNDASGRVLPQRPASLIFYGGEMLSLDPARAGVEALAVADGKILALGSKAEVMAARGPDTRLINLQGKTLLPSLKDHHVHLLNVGLALLNKQRGEGLFLDLSAARSQQEIAERVAQRAAKLPKGSWILGQGWNQGLWGSTKLPTHRVLSRAAPENPVYLARVDGHAGWSNAAALKAGGITTASPAPAGGAVLRLRDGSPSGVLLERANEPVLAVIPEPADEDIIEAFRLATRTLAARGITEVYDAGFLAVPGVVGLNRSFERYFELLRQLDAEEPLPLQVNLMVPAPSALADAVRERPEAFAVSPRLRVSHIKLFADGALGSRGAALSRSYADDPSTSGVHRMTLDELGKEVKQSLEAGLDVATHAIGDEAVSRVLTVYESVLSADAKLSPRRLRIEHFSYASAADRERAARLGVVLVIQPGFVYPGDDGRTMEDSRLGEERSEGAYAWRQLSEMGAVLAGSSDDFGELPHPLWNFYAAVTRKNPAGQPEEGWHPSERLDRDTSLRLFTALFPPGGEAVVESELRAGGPADLVILSGNPLTTKEEQLLQLKVHATLREGQVTFQDGSLEGLR